MESIGRDFQAPLSPTTEHLQMGSNPSSFRLCGELLESQISDFYAWYMAWDSIPCSHAKNFQSLSQIKQIARVCLQGGAYLSEREEKHALESLNDLKNGLYDGTVQQQEIPGHLQRIISDLTFVNHKARLVSHTTELEYRLCIHPPLNQSPEI